jgi:hypothetical protein
VDADQITVEARRVDGGEVIEVQLKPEGGGRFATAWSAPREGVWSLHAIQPVMPGANTARLDVRSEEPERVDATPDHAALRQLAEATGGRVVAPSEIGDLAKWAPRRSVTIRMPIDWPLWDRWPVFALLALLLTVEWIGRRALRLT